MHDTTRSRGGLTAAAALLLCAALLGLLVITSFAEYSFPQDPAEVGALVAEGSNEPFFTYIVLYAIQFALLGGGMAAVGATATERQRAGGALGIAAGVVGGVGAAVLTISPVLMSGLVNRWSPELMESDAAVWEVLDAFRFGADQAGYGILAIGLVVLAVAIFVSRSLPSWTGIPVVLVALVLLGVVTGGDDVLPVLPFAASLILGATFLIARWVPKARH